MRVTFLILSTFLSFSALAQDQVIRGADRNRNECSVSIDAPSLMIGFSDSKGMCEFGVSGEDLLALERAKSNGESITISGYSNWFDCQVKFVYGENQKLKRLILKRWMALALTYKSTACLPNPQKP